MSKRLRILVGLLTVVFMLVSVMAGCKTSGSNGSQTEGTTAVETSEQATETQPPKEPITLSVFLPLGETPVSPGIQDDPVAKEIERVTGVTMDITVNTGNQILDVMVASGDLADITSIDNEIFIEPLIQSGSIIDMGPYLENTPNLVKNAGKAIEYSKDVLSNGTGKLYAITQRAKTNASPMIADYDGVFVRWDYYKDIGKPVINNVDDLVNMAVKMLEAHPTNQDGKKNYGFTTMMDWGLWGIDYNNYSTKYSGLVGIPGMANFNMVTNEYVQLLDNRHRLWKGAEMYYKANKAGVLDPESFTQKFEIAQQKTDEGRVMVQFPRWMLYGFNGTDAGTTGTYVEIPMPDTEEYTAWYARSAPFGFKARTLVVSSKCKAPDRAMELIDYLFSAEGSRTIMSGVKGRTWDEKDGAVTLKEGVLESLKADAEFKVKEGTTKYKGIVGFDYDAVDQNGQYINLFLDPRIAVEAYTPAEKEYIQHFGITNMIELIEKRQYKGTINGGIESLIAPPTPDINRINTRIDDYLKTEIVKLIMSKDDAEYNALKDKIFEEIKKMEYDTMNQYFEKAFKAAIEKFNNY